MQCRPIVPQIDAAWRKRDLGDVADDPLHVMLTLTDPLATDFERGGRNIESDDVPHATVQQIIHER